MWCEMKLSIPWIIFVALHSSVYSMGSNEGPKVPCESHPCQHNGTCIDLTTAFVCQCPEGYHGLQCETHETELDTSACDNNPCVNGVCSTTGLGSFTCMCSLGWKGVLCERDKNECDEDPDTCSKHEVCINSEGSYDCKESCDDAWCNNGGSCIISDETHEGFQCICPPSYAGTTCQILLENATPPAAIEESCVDNLCQNDAVCTPSSTNTKGYTCTCPTGYTGALCQVALYSTCIHEDITYREDERRTEDCNECYCQRGSWLCTNKHCGSIMGSFDFIGNPSFVEGEESSFTRAVKDDLIKKFSIPQDMVEILPVNVFEGDIQVAFVLQPLASSKLDVKVVSSHMRTTLKSGNYSFYYNDQHYVVNTSSVIFQPYTEGTTAPIGPGNDDLTLLIVLVTISIVLFIIVCVAAAGILSSNRRKAKKKAKGYQHNNGTEIQNLNNSNVVTINNKLYNIHHEDITSNSQNNIKETNLTENPQSHIYEVVDENRLFSEPNKEEPSEVDPLFSSEVSRNSGSIEEDITQDRTLAVGEHTYEDEIHNEEVPDDACCAMEKEILERDILNENYYVKLEKPED